MLVPTLEPTCTGTIIGTCTGTNHDHLQRKQSVCSLLRNGVLGIFGPLTSATSMHVQSICDSLEIPHLETRWDFQEERNDLSINLFPRPAILSRAFIDLIKAWDWKSFAVMYEENEGVMRMQDVLNEAPESHWRINLYQFKPGTAFRDIFWKARANGETNIVLDVRTENIALALKHAQQVGMMTQTYSYLITSLEVHMVDLEDYRYGGTRISSLRLMDNTSMEYEDWARMSDKDPKKVPHPSKVTTQSALLYDAVKLFAQALQELDQSQAIDLTNSVNCENEVPWPHGSSVVNYMRPITFKGVTGLVSFDQKGFRNSMTLSVMTTTEQGLTKVGTWNEEKRLQIPPDFLSYYVKIAMQNLTLTVTTLINEPYTMHKRSSERMEGNDRFEGYCVDLLHEISKIVGFKYTIKIVKDNAYGVAENGQWNGLIGDLLRGDADLALVDLTITASREAAVDFTHPFMYTGISILFKKPTQKVTSLFSFLSPFSSVVWVYVLGAYVGVSVILFVVGRLSPYEWDNPHPCRQDDQVLMNDFSLLNSFWFTTGSLMQQGSDLQPKSMSTRTIAGIWYFFTLITISSYTANLAAFLTVEKTVSPIDSAEDLSLQSEIKYGCVKTGSTKLFFKDSTFPTYQRMWKFMSSDESNFVASNSQGKERVARGNYAFLMESAAIEYIVERNCNLTQVGSNLDSKGYGIATRKDSIYRTTLSRAILELQERGVLQTLKDRWWKQRRGGGACASEGKGGGGVNELSLDNVGGVFVVLIGGLIISIATAVLEFLWRSRKNAPDRSSLCSEMTSDIKFALSCQSSTKAAKKRAGSGTGSGGPLNRFAEFISGPDLGSCTKLLPVPPLLSCLLSAVL